MSSPRLQYIDCLRGVTMLMVVYSHVLSFMMGGINPSPLGQYMRDIMLPLFFFISGFCAYKANREWNTIIYIQQIWKKIRAILIPTVVMFLLFMAHSGKDAGEFIFRYDKSGYWFTWVLFQIFIVYFSFEFICSRIGNLWVKVVATLSPLLIFAIVFKFIGYNSPAAYLFEWVKVVGFYFFFIAGVFVRWFQPQIDKFLSLKYASSILLTTSIVLYYALGGGKILILNIILFYYAFSSLEPWFSRPGNIVSKVLIAIGKNTIEIYFIHFFILFCIPVIPEWLQTLQSDKCFGMHSSSSFAEFFIVGTTSIGLSYACIALKEIISLFPPISKLCFGK